MVNIDTVKRYYINNLSHSMIFAVKGTNNAFSYLIYY